MVDLTSLAQQQQPDPGMPGGPPPDPRSLQQAPAAPQPTFNQLMTPKPVKTQDIVASQDTTGDQTQQQQFTRLVEADVRMLIGDLQVQLIVANNVIKQLQTKIAEGTPELPPELRPNGPAVDMRPS